MPKRHVSKITSSSFQSAFLTIQRVQRPWTSSFFVLLLGIAGIALPYMLSNWLNASREFHFTPYIDLELQIPRVNWMIIPYVSAYLMGLASLPVLPFLAQKALAKSMTVAGIIGGILFIVCPTQLGYPRSVDGLGDWRPFYEILWTLDLPYNLTPSMHVTMAYLLIVPVMYSCQSRLVKWSLGIWLLMVCISIILVHQHHTLDLITGFLLGWLCDYFIYRPKVIAYARDMVWSTNLDSYGQDKDAA